MPSRAFCFNGKTIKDIYAVGFPSIIMQAIGSVMNMGMNGILATFSDTAVAVWEPTTSSSPSCLCRCSA